MVDLCPLSAVFAITVLLFLNFSYANIVTVEGKDKLRMVCEMRQEVIDQSLMLRSRIQFNSSQEIYISVPFPFAAVKLVLDCLIHFDSACDVSPLSVNDVMNVLELCQYLMIPSLRQKWEREILTSWPLEKLVQMYQMVDKAQISGLREVLVDRIRDCTKKSVKDKKQKGLGSLRSLKDIQRNEIFSAIDWNISDLKRLKCQHNPFSHDRFILANVHSLAVSEDLKLFQEISKCFKTLTVLSISLSLWDFTVSSPRDVAVSIANSANLNTLRELMFQIHDFGDDGVIAISNSQYLSNLEVLNLFSCNITDYGVSALVESPNVKHLTQLDLCNNRLGSESLKSIANSKNLKNLQKLLLNGMKLSDSDFNIFDSFENLPNLTKLGLCRTWMSDQGAIALARSKYLLNLKHLYLQRNLIGTQGFQAIARSPFLKNLIELNLSQNNIGNTTINWIVESGNSSSLKILRLGYNHMTLNDVIELANEQFLKTVVELELQSNGLCDRSVEVLANSTHLASLNILNLSSNHIGTQGAKALNTKNLNSLSVLHLDDNRLGDEGVKLIANSENLKNLRFLDVRGNNVSQAGARAILDSEYLKKSQNLYAELDDEIDLFY